MSMPVRREGFRIVQGEPALWYRTAASGRLVACAFCKSCGTRIYHAPERNSAIVNIKPGTFDDPSDLVPVGHVWYYQILAPLVRRVDIWESEYLHVLEGDNPVFDWTKGTALRPYLDVLDESDRGAFLATYATRISAAYQKQPDGRTLLPFRRIFLIARS
jgi:hypothetical protein